MLLRFNVKKVLEWGTRALLEPINCPKYSRWLVRKGSLTRVVNATSIRDELMKKIAILSVLAAILAFATPSFAGVYMGTNAAMPEKMHPMGCDDDSDCPCQSHHDIEHAHTHHAITVTLYEGSLKGNIERIIKAEHWKKLVWKLPYDYQWVGKTDFTGETVEGVIAQLLKHYPLQAVFYKANQVVEIVPRYQYNV